MKRDSQALFVMAFLVATVGAHGQAVPEWQTTAGGKMAFEVASVRLTKPGDSRASSVPMGNDDAIRPSGGIFRADFPVWVFIQFAYKLNPDQANLLRDSLPKWAATERYSVDARMGNPKATKDQQRLMVQSLLAERFGLSVHFETKEMPVLAMTLLKPGVVGPKLVLHEKGPPCDAVATISADRVPSFFPLTCGEYSLHPMGGQRVSWGSRNTTMDLLATSLNERGDLGKPVVDRTGLKGRFDFLIDWTMETLPASTSEPDAPVTTFLEALKDQLGMKLELTRAVLQVLVVDHLERSTEN